MVGDVGHDLAQCVDVAQVTGLGGQPARPVGDAGSLDEEVAGAAGRGECAELVGEHGLLPGPDAVHHGDVAGSLVQLLEQGAHGRDADAGAHEEHLAVFPHPGVQPAVGALDEHPGAGAQRREARGPVAEVCRREPQGPAVRGRGDRVGVGARPAGTVEEPPLEELAGAHRHPADPAAGRR